MRHFSKKKYTSQKSANNWQTLSIIGGIIFLFAIIGWMFAGITGLLVMGCAVSVSLYLLSKSRTSFILRHYNAREISPHENSHLNAIFQQLVQRAGLAKLPKLFYLPSNSMIAFAVGPNRETASVAVSDAILRNCNRHEVAAILAHEISHIKNGDTLILGVADVFSRMTSIISNVGLFLIFMSLPAMFVSGEWIPWWFTLLLLGAPLLSSLLQLALSRTREFNADLDAAALTGDPRALASALRKVEYGQMNFWQRVFMPYRRGVQPSLLSTHPPTEERIERLLELEETIEIREERAVPVRYIRSRSMHHPQYPRSYKPAHRILEQIG